ncbi:MAG: beta-ketoacyl-ACP synthase II [Actinomycetota bacterium]
MSLRRVVVTGLGAVTPHGNGIKPFWEGIIAGRSAVGPLTSVRSESLPSKIAAECTEFDPVSALGAKLARRLDRSTQLAMVAARDAWQDADIDGRVDRDSAGVAFATGIGGIQSLLSSQRVLLEKGADKVSPFTIPRLIPNAAAGHIAMDLGVRGPNFCPVTACAASNHAIGQSWQTIRTGEAEVMIAGGTESGLTELTIAAFAQMAALSTKYNDRPWEASRPFDADRDGLVMGEGAGALILEEREAALARGAHVYAELIGFGQSADAFHITAPSEDGAGAALAMQRALRTAGVNADEVGYINAHGTATRAGDVSETKAVKSVFGERAYSLAVSSTKSMTGHLFGAAGAVEAIATILALRHSLLPPTINQFTRDPECDLDYVPNEARKANVEVGLSNGFGFGGHNAVVVFRRADQRRSM